MKNIEIVGVVNEVDVEDGGCAQIGHIDVESSSGTDDSFFVRLQSWSETDVPVHITMASLKGKKVHITISVQD